MRSACKWKMGDMDPDSTTKRLWRSDVTAPRMLRIVEKTIRQTGDDHYGVVQQWWGAMWSESGSAGPLLVSPPAPFVLMRWQRSDCVANGTQTTIVAH